MGKKKYRLSIRSIKKLYHVGQSKAQIIQLKHYDQAFLGRKPLDITQEEEKYILNYKGNFNVGYQRLFNVMKNDINAPGTITERKVRNFFDFHDLYTCKHEFINNEHNLRFVAKYANQAWHTDLHYLEKLPNEDHQCYLIGFLDDRTRKILYYEILENKEAISTSRALENALKFNSKPKTLIIDNGKEFVAESFIDVLKKNGIEKHNVTPYTPQENGKVERFWKTIEKAKTRPLRGSYLDSIIEQYNNFWVHNGLKEITNKNLTPNQAWEEMVHYNNQDDANYIYY